MASCEGLERFWNTFSFWNAKADAPHASLRKANASYDNIAVC